MNVVVTQWHVTSVKSKLDIRNLFKRYRQKKCNKSWIVLTGNQYLFETENIVSSKVQ